GPAPRRRARLDPNAAGARSGRPLPGRLGAGAALRDAALLDGLDRAQVAARAVRLPAKAAAGGSAAAELPASLELRPLRRLLLEHRGRDRAGDARRGRVVLSGRLRLRPRALPRPQDPVLRRALVADAAGRGHDHPEVPDLQAARLDRHADAPDRA